MGCLFVFIVLAGVLWVKVYLSIIKQVAISVLLFGGDLNGQPCNTRSYQSTQYINCISIIMLQDLH